MYSPLMCARVGCTNHATKKPVLVLFPVGINIPRSDAARAALSIQVCDEHATKTAAHWLGHPQSEAWAQIEHAFKAVGKMTPDYHRTEVEYQDIQ